MQIFTMFLGGETNDVFEYLLIKKCTG